MTIKRQKPTLFSNFHNWVLLKGVSQFATEGTFYRYGLERIAVDKATTMQIACCCIAWSAVGHQYYVCVLTLHNFHNSSPMIFLFLS